MRRRGVARRAERLAARSRPMTASAERTPRPALPATGERTNDHAHLQRRRTPGRRLPQPGQETAPGLRPSTPASGRARSDAACSTTGSATTTRAARPDAPSLRRRSPAGRPQPPNGSRASSTADGPSSASSMSTCPGQGIGMHADADAFGPGGRVDLAGGRLGPCASAALRTGVQPGRAAGRQDPHAAGALRARAERIGADPLMHGIDRRETAAQRHRRVSATFRTLA